MLKLEELKRKCKGVDIVLVSPFKENEEVDYDGFKENIAFLKDKMRGNDVLITPTGSCGEFCFLSEEEHKKLIKLAVEEVDGEFPVIAGAGYAGTKKTIDMCKYAEEVGADGLQLILPYYFVPTEEGMYEHYKTIAEAVSIGIIPYNNPAFSKSWIKPALMKKLSEIDNIVGVKENNPHIMLFEGMVRELKSTDMAIFCGLGEGYYAYHCLNEIAGIVSSFANFGPELSYEMYEAASKKDFAKVLEVKEKMRPWFAFLGKMAAAHAPDTGALPKPGGVIYGEGNIRFGIIKEAMNLMGLKGGKVRLPLTRITIEEKAELKEALKKMGLM